MNLDSIDKKISARIATFDPNSVPFKIAAFCAHSGDSWFWCAVLFSFWLFAEDKTRQVLAFWGLSIAITAVMIFFVKRFFGEKRRKDRGEVSTAGMIRIRFRLVTPYVPD